MVTSETQTSFEQNEPTFDGETFKITRFSTNPEGLHLIASGVERSAALPAGMTFNDLRPEERLEVRDAVQADFGFRGKAAVVTARTEWRNATDTDERNLLREVYRKTRDRFQNRGSKLGFRNIRPDASNPDALVADVTAVPFEAYRRLSRPESSAAAKELSRASGVAMALVTADNRIIVQHRAIERIDPVTSRKKPGNALYNDIPGASVAGMVDASMQSPGRKPGAPDDITSESLSASILKEAGEELGLAPSNIIQSRIVGLAEDKIQLHDEILFLAKTDLTAEAVRENSKTSTRNKNLDAVDLEEKFFDIPATPEAIETLLADVHCPLPPTHAAVFVAAGFMLVLEQTGSRVEAETWAAQLEARVQDNYKTMNQLVREYYEIFPEARSIVPERMWGKTVPQRDLSSYRPDYSPSEQGLEDLEDGLIRVGLAEDKRTHVDTAYLFDVDGVLTDPATKKVDRDEIFTELLERLRAGLPVAFNTGRSTKWVFDNVIAPMSEKSDNKNILENAIIIGEKGASWATFNEEGDPSYGIVESLNVPNDLRKEIEVLIGKYSDSMANLDPKQTMFSIEMLDGLDIASFQAVREQFATELQQLLDETPEGSAFRIDKTTIATDVESPYVGKALGTERFLEFLKSRNIKAEHFIAFGDSPSDLSMADELARRGQNVDMVYVGDPEKLKSTQRFTYEVIRMAGHTAATASFLADEAQPRR